MRFARVVFTVAGVYGLLAIIPFYFLEARIGREMPPAITHPEYYYGFVGVTLAWQVLFLLIARDPSRYRLMMLPSVLEKWSYTAALIVLFLSQRVSAVVFTGGIIDFILGLLFLASYLKTAGAEK